jgi:hypothetical protein
MKQLFLTLCCCLFLGACVNWDITGPAGPEGPQGPPGQKPDGADTSTIYGRVFTYNEYTTARWPVDSVKITLHLSPDSTLETMADTAGFYQFNGIGTGTYNLTFTRNRFGTMKVFGLSHMSGNLNTEVQRVSLVERPVRTVPDSATFGISREYFYLKLYINVPQEYLGQGLMDGNYDIYWSKEATVSDSNYLIGTHNNRVDTAVMNQYFSHGDSVYALIYAIPRLFWTEQMSWYSPANLGVSYLDPATGEVVIPYRSIRTTLAKGIYP